RDRPAPRADGSRAAPPAQVAGGARRGQRGAAAGARHRLLDTAFHATMPEAAATYAVPRDWWKRLHVRRYGFHGLSHSYASRRAAQMLRRSGGDGFRVVTCHLGAGASLA